MNYVVGSGPAGISAAFALIEAGQSVTLLDTGIVLEDELASKVNSLSKTDEGAWDQDFIAKMKSSMEANANGVPLKTLYSSDFPFRPAKNAHSIHLNEAEAIPSYARGGFSNVWGASVLPYVDSDLSDWPISTEDLAPHYQNILSIIELAGESDGLAEKFPLYTDTLVKTQTSRQTNAFLVDLSNSKSSLNEEGIFFGKSRIALRRMNIHGRSCSYCGMCMYGCPYDLIYSTSQTLERLKLNPRFHYLGGVLVRSFIEENECVKILAEDLKTSRPLTFSADRLFIGAGVFSTAKIILKSLDAWNTEITAKDSQYFLFPIFRWNGIAGVDTEKLNTLAQAYLEIRDLQIDPNYIHLQIYSYNELYIAAIRASLGPFLFKMLRPIVIWFISRLLIVQGYLHSSSSGTLAIHLEAATSEKNENLCVTGSRTSDQRDIILKILKKLRKKGRLLRAIPLRFLLKVPATGRGFHTGGTFPMRKTPRKFETDTLGRLKGLNRTHIVDASVFPSIPATTITFSIMANAHRIATEAVREIK